MATYHLSVPSKTFIVGEYIALKGGPALILSAEPRFELRAALISELSLSKIEKLAHPDSPAGKLLQQDYDFYSRYSIEFTDPYKGAGGFGASTAQFLMLEAFKSIVTKICLEDRELLNKYVGFAWNGQGSAPSGADLIAQRHGGLCFYHKAEKKLKIFDWPFSDMHYGLIHTGNKLTTHTHLQNMPSIDGSELEETALLTIASLESNDKTLFVDSINQYSNLLKNQNLVARHTLDMLKKIHSLSFIDGAKGCGALGADVILILFQPFNREKVLAWVKQNNLNLIIVGHEVAEGLIQSKGTM